MLDLRVQFHHYGDFQNPKISEHAALPYAVALTPLDLMALFCAMFSFHSFVVKALFKSLLVASISVSVQNCKEWSQSCPWCWVEGKHPLQLQLSKDGVWCVSVAKGCEAWTAWTRYIEAIVCGGL